MLTNSGNTPRDEKVIGAAEKASNALLKALHTEHPRIMQSLGAQRHNGEAVL